MNSLRKFDASSKASVIPFAASERRATLQRRLDEIAVLRRRGRGHLWLVPKPGDPVRFPGFEPYQGPDAA